jgi:hypothetical protein
VATDPCLPAWKNLPGEEVAKQKKESQQEEDGAGKGPTHARYLVVPVHKFSAGKVQGSEVGCQASLRLPPWVLRLVRAVRSQGSRAGGGALPDS